VTNPLDHMLESPEMTIVEALFAGKTVERVESPMPSPYDGRPDESRFALHFTDGSVVEIHGSGSDMDGYVQANELSRDEQLERAHKAVDAERKQEETRIKRKEWMALSCEEREAEIAKRRASRKPLDLLVEDGMMSMIEDFYRPIFSFTAQPERVVRDLCPKCRERECPNAPTRTLPATRGLTGPWTATIEPGSAMATKTKARRS
jgi:hypothetical protein